MLLDTHQQEGQHLSELTGGGGLAECMVTERSLYPIAKDPEV